MGNAQAQNDWEDQDLLTKDLATSLLDDEITAQRTWLAGADRDDQQASSHEERVKVEQRLTLLIEARDRLR